MFRWVRTGVPIVTHRLRPKTTGLSFNQCSFTKKLKKQPLDSWVPHCGRLLLLTPLRDRSNAQDNTNSQVYVSTLASPNEELL